MPQKQSDDNFDTADAQDPASNILDIGETAAHYRIKDLKQADIVSTDIETHHLVHEPTDLKFTSDQALAYFHSGFLLGGDNG